MNTLLTISMITQEALRVLENNLVITKHVNREYDDKFGVSGAKIGTTLNIRKPPRYLGRTGQALQLEDSTETSVPLVLDTQFGVDIQFTSQDLALTIDDFADRFLKPAVATIANKIDSDVAGLYYKIYNAVGTPGTTPADLITYLTAGVKLDNSAAPQDEQRSVFLTSYMQAILVDFLKGLFNQAAEIGQQYVKGKMGVSSGFNWFMDQNMATHTVGALGGTPLVNGASQSGASLITDGWTASAAQRLNVGDIFTLGNSASTNVYGVNPQSRQSTGFQQQFVVTAPGTSDGAGNMTISIDPPIIGPGSQFQTVVALPADNATVNVLGAANTVTPQGLAIHKDCITLACADLPLPRGVDMASRISDDQLGLSIRLVRDYDINTDNFPCRLDILYGVGMLRPELGVRICA